MTLKEFRSLGVWNYVTNEIWYYNSFTIGVMEHEYSVVIGNKEKLFKKLEDAEEYLWNEFAKDEINGY